MNTIERNIIKSIICLVFMLVLLVTAPMANASNIIVDGGFESSTITSTATYDGTLGTWLTDGAGSNAWTIQTDGPYEGSKYARSGEDRYSLYQVVHYAGDAGDIVYDYYRKINGSGLNFNIYGSNTQPAIGSSWSTASDFGTSIVGNMTSGPAGGWLPSSGSRTENNAYTWYTIRFRGKLSGSAYASVDSLSVDVPSAVPLPGALWLLGSGLFGLVAVRRRKDKA